MIQSYGYITPVFPAIPFEFIQFLCPEETTLFDDYFLKFHMKANKAYVCLSGFLIRQRVPSKTYLLFLSFMKAE